MGIPTLNDAVFTNGGTLVNDVGLLSIIPTGQLSRRVQVSVVGTGAVTARVGVYGSLKGTAYAKLYTVTLSGTGSDASLESVNADGIFMKFIVEAITGTGAAVSASVI
jgi:hypothetical protein